MAKPVTPDRFGYITSADTARLIRAQFKRHFPGVKFSVRSDHNSINIKWTDGPTRAAVEAITGPFEGGGFDGMIDLAYSVESYLCPDGSAAYGYSGGTEGSMGSEPGYAYAPPDGAVPVKFSAHYIFVERSYSEGFARRIRDEIAGKWSRVPGDFPEIRTDGGYGWCLDWDHPSNYGANAGPGGCDPQRMFRDAAEQVTA